MYPRVATERMYFDDRASATRVYKVACASRAKMLVCSMTGRRVEACGAAPRLVGLCVEAWTFDYT